ncbi:hypothetical protein SAMN05444167_3688 [Terriglobus roseus]|uniref:Uncharacterized protein n=1 Tax=Terriglobus roseus TaxID=392734 RepID=A0A1G7Q1D2_9BACT|nr:hypothetical protein SAMN05444167_3688 [Terriglobus roseus]
MQVFLPESQTNGAFCSGSIHGMTALRDLEASLVGHGSGRVANLLHPWLPVTAGVTCDGTCHFAGADRLAQAALFQQARDGCADCAFSRFHSEMAPIFYT